MGASSSDPGNAVSRRSVIMGVIGVTRDNAGHEADRGSADAPPCGIYILVFLPVCGFVWGAAGVCWCGVFLVGCGSDISGKGDEGHGWFCPPAF